MQRTTESKAWRRVPQFLSLCAVAQLACWTAQGQSYGIATLPIAEGNNVVCPIVHNIPASILPAVSAPAANQIQFAAASFTANAFNEADLDAGGPLTPFRQYYAIVTLDASAPGSSLGIAGNWWPIINNTATTLTVDNRGIQDLTTIIGVGDIIEVRKMTSMQDLFGNGATYILNKDNGGGIANPADEDVIRTIVGTSFAKTIIHLNASQGNQYLVSGGGGQAVGGNGSQLTIEPDQNILVQRKAGTGPVGATALGWIQTTPIMHYLAANGYVVGTGKFWPSLLPVSNLGGWGTPGWRDNAGVAPSFANNDLFRGFLGSSFKENIYRVALSGFPVTWADASGTFVPNANRYALPAGQGQAYFVASAVQWQQP